MFADPRRSGGAPPGDGLRLRGAEVEPPGVPPVPLPMGHRTRGAVAGSLLALLLSSGCGPGPEVPGARVRVVGPSGEPAPYARVVLRGAGDRPPEVRYADVEGRLLVDGVPLDGSVGIAVDRWSWSRDPVAYQPLGAGDVRLESAGLLTLEVDLRDAETGLPVPGTRWRYLMRHDPRGASPVVPAEEPLSAPLPAGWEALLHLTVEPPPGYVAWDLARYWVRSGGPSHRVRIVHPLRREVPVAFRAERDTAGAPVAPVVVGFALGTLQAVWTWAEPEGDGWIRVPGVPFFRDVPATLWVGDRVHADRYPTSPSYVRPTEERYARRPGTVRVPFRLGARDGEPISVETVLPPVDARTDGADFSTRDVGTTELQPAHPSEPWEEVPPETPRGDLEVRVTRSDGSPGADLEVSAYRNRGKGTFRRVGRTDAAGVLTFAGVPALRGTTVACSVPGGLFSPETLDVAADGGTTVDLRESPGATLRVRAVDAGGNPAPYAWLGAYARFEGHVTIDGWTDHRGEALRTRLRAGPGRVRAARGHTIDYPAWPFVEKEVLLEEGRTAEVTLVLPPD